MFGWSSAATRALTIEAFAELLLGDLDRDLAAKPCVERLEDLAHAAGAEEAENQIRSQLRPRTQRAKTFLAIGLSLVGHLLDVVLREPHPFRNDLEARVFAKARE
jgi:hypothetical protein